MVAAGLISSLALAYLINLGTRDPRWGTDFWQRVLVSVLGTLGAFLIAVVLFYWKRHYDRRDDHAQRQEELRWKLAETVHEYRNKVLGEPQQLTAMEGYRDALSLIFAVDEYGDRIDDPAIKNYCRIHKAELLAFWTGAASSGHPNNWFRGYVAFLVAISASLPAYLTVGQELTTATIETTPEPPDPHRESRGDSEGGTGPLGG